MSSLPKHREHHYFCVVCSLHFPLYPSADAHVLSHHPGQRPDRILDVLELLPDPARSEIINVARATLARGVLDSAVKAKGNHKRGNAVEHTEDQSPSRRSKAARLPPNAPTGGPGNPRSHGSVRKNLTNAPAPIASVPIPLPTFLLRTRGARLIFNPPPGTICYLGLLTSIAAVYDVAIPGAAEFDWIEAAKARWVVMVGRMGGGGGLKRFVLQSDEDVVACLLWEDGELVGSRVRVMELGQEE